MSMLGIFDCPVMFCDIVIHLPVTQQIKITKPNGSCSALSYSEKTSSPLKIVRFRGTETEYTAESKCVSFPVCYVTNANYLISPGGADVRFVLKHLRNQPKGKLVTIPTAPDRLSTMTFVSELLKVSSYKSTISHLRFCTFITRAYFGIV